MTTGTDEHIAETPAALVRLLINDVDTTSPVFSERDIASFLALEGGSVKLAAAQALDVIADDEALTAKVIRDSDGKSTDGPKVAESLRKRAESLRKQARAEADAADDGFFQIVPGVAPSCWPELTERWV